MPLDLEKLRHTPYAKWDRRDVAVRFSRFTIGD